MLDRDRKRPQKGLKHFKWAAIEAAIERGTNAEPRWTLERCLQDLYLEPLHGDANNEIREAMRNSLPCLSADFLVLARRYLRQFWQKQQQKQLVEENVFEFVSPKLNIVSKLAALADGSHAAFETFTLFYHVILRRALSDASTADEIRWLLIRFDEVLLDVARTSPSARTLVTWRQRLVNGLVTINQRTLKASQMLPRSMRYMEEAHARCVFRMLALKIAGHVLPVELVELIYLELLTAEHCARDDEMETAWSPIVWPEQGYPRGSTFKKCCGCPNTKEARRLYRPSTHSDILRWSSAEHCYNRFHAERADKTLINGLQISHSVEGIAIVQNVLIFRRCRRMLWTPLEQTTIFERPPIPFPATMIEISQRERKRIGSGEWNNRVESSHIDMSTDTIDSDFEI